MGGFNVTTGSKCMIDFCELNDLSRLTDKLTFYENLFDKPTFI